MVHSIGDQIEEVASLFISKIKADNMPDVAISVAGEVRNIPNENRPIRIIHKFQRGHKSTTDVVIKREGKNLFIKYSSKPRTMLAYLKFLWRSGMFAVLFCIVFSAYLAFTGSKTSWVQDYAAKNVSTKNVSTVYRDDKKAPFFTDTILKGVYKTEFNQLREDLLKIDSFEKRVDDYLYLKAEKEVSDSNNAIDKLINNTKGDEAAKLKTRKDYLSENLFKIDRALLPGKFTDSACFMIGVFYNPFERLTNPPFGRKNGGSDYENNQFVCDWLIAINCCDYATTQSFYLTVNSDSGMEFNCIKSSLHTIWAIDDRYREILKTFFSLDKDLQLIILNTFDKATTYEKPWSYRKLFFADPKIAFSNFGMPASIFATFIGFFVWRAPLSWLRFPCKILRWPTPDDFNNSCQARNAWVERVFSETLFDMGINKTDILELSMGQTQS
jgi:hypothetical protein